MTNDAEACRFGCSIKTNVLRSTLSMVDLVPVLVLVAPGVLASLEGELDTEEGGPCSYFAAGGALAGTPVGGAGGQGSSENGKNATYAAVHFW